MFADIIRGAVDISCPSGSFGSGFLIDRNHVLTAAHVLMPCKKGVLCNVSPLSDPSRSISAHVDWLDEQYDCCVLALKEPLDGVEPVEFGFVPKQLREGLVCTGLGFPEAQMSRGISEDRWLRGRIDWVHRGERFDVNLETPAPAKAELWGGFSGTAVFCDDALVGLVKSYGPGFAGKVLRANPIQSLFERTDFRAYLTSVGHSPICRPVSTPDDHLAAQRRWDQFLRQLRLTTLLSLTLLAAILMLSAPFLRPKESEVLIAHDRARILREVDNFVASNIGRPGEERNDPSRTGVLVGSTRSIQTTLASFEAVRSTIPMLIDALSSFLQTKEAFDRCVQSLRTQFAPLDETQLRDRLEASLWSLRRSYERLTTSGLKDKPIVQFSPTEIVRIFSALPFFFSTHVSHVKWMFDFVTDTGKNDHVCAAVRMDLSRDDFGDGLLVLGRYSGIFSGEALIALAKRKGLPGLDDVQEYLAEVQGYQALIRSADSTILALVGLPLPEFYRGVDEEKGKYEEMIKVYAGYQSPLITSRLARVPVESIALMSTVVLSLMYGMLIYSLYAITPLPKVRVETLNSSGLVYLPGFLLPRKQRLTASFLSTVVALCVPLGVIYLAAIFMAPSKAMVSVSGLLIADRLISLDAFIASFLKMSTYESRLSWWMLGGGVFLLTFAIYLKLLHARLKGLYFGSGCTSLASH